MRVLHSAYMLKREPGVFNQMSWEQESAIALGIDWDCRLFCPNMDGHFKSDVVVSYAPSGTRRAGFIGKIIEWFKFRRVYYRWLREQADHYDVLLLRYSMYDPLRYLFLLGIDRPVYSVHHTLEQPELWARSDFFKVILVVAEAILARLSLSMSTGIVAVTNEIRLYEVKRAGRPNMRSTVYPNGLWLTLGDVAGCGDARNEVIPEMIFLASKFVPWHGLDLLLDSMAGVKENFILHVVGEIFSQDRMRAAGDERVIFHGLCSQEEISQISERCWIGLSSFALERKGMVEACTLKAREYLMNGMPVFSGHPDVFEQDFPFYRVGAPDIVDILEYCNEVRASTREEVVRAAIPFISKVMLVEELYAWLRKNSPK